MEMQTTVTGVASIAVFIAVLVWAWKVLNWAWLTPKRMERLLKQQGLPGTPYQLLVGDIKRDSGMSSKAESKPINLTDHIAPRVIPFLHQTVEKYGRTSYTWMGPAPRVTLMNPEHVNELFNRVYDFRKPKRSPFATSVITGLVNYDGDKWSKHRKILTPAFFHEKLKNMVPAFLKSCDDMIRIWDELLSNVASSNEVNVWPYLTSMTSDAISRTAFGSNYEEGKKIFELQEEQGRLVRQALQMVFIPGWRFVPTKMQRRMKQTDREVRTTLTRIIEKKQKALKAGVAVNDDLLGIMLATNSEQAQGCGMSLEDVMEECKLFYFAGEETTSVLLVWTMILLSQHQDWQSRAREEVLQVFGQDGEPDFDGLSHLKVVRMILYEVLRLYPPLAALQRVVEKQMKLGDLTLPAGTDITVPVLLIHRDEALWGEDANEFKPERFADGVLKATKNRVAFLPFGWGPRICIGQNSALIEAKVALSLILRRFRFQLSPSYTHAPRTVIMLEPQFGAPLIMQKL